MKLSLTYDASHVSSDYLEQAIKKTGGNTSFTIITAQHFSQSKIKSIFGLVKSSTSLTADFNGAQLDSGELENAVKAASGKIGITLNTAQSTPLKIVLDALKEAGDSKSLASTFNGSQLTSDNLEKTITASGKNSSVSLNTAQYLSSSHLQKVLTTAGSTKSLSMEFNGAQLDASETRNVISKSGTRVSARINTAQSLSKNVILDLISAASSNRNLALDFNGAQLSVATFIDALKAAGKNTILSINTAQSISKSDILKILAAAGSTKELRLEFNGSQINSKDMLEVIGKSGEKTSLSINTAQSITAADLLSLTKAAGNSKSLLLAFDGSRLTSDDLQRTVSAAGSKTSITVSNAYKTPINVILEIVGKAG